MSSNEVSLCPRCDTPRPEAVSTSPVAGCWTVYLCGTCFYTWRTTEPSYATDPATYAPQFKIRPGDIPGMTSVPAVPPRRG